MAVTAAVPTRGRRKRRMTPAQVEAHGRELRADLAAWDAAMHRQADELEATLAECRRLAARREALQAADDAERAEADRLAAVA